MNKTLRTGLMMTLITGICLSCLLGFSQSNKRNTLEKNKKQIEEEITYTNKLLTETRKNRQLSVNQVVILNDKIQKREQLISTINSQVDDLYSEIDTRQQHLEQLQENLKSLKKEYARMIYQSFKNRSSYNRLMFIFAAKDFNQAYKRLKYFQQYSTFRHAQANLILKTQEEINNRIGELNGQKNEKLGLLKNKESEKSKLTQEKEEKSQTVSQLQQKEKELKKKLKVKENALKKLQIAIENLIAEEIKKSAGPSKPGSGAKPSASPTLSLTPEEKELSSSFSTNKGKLPWPIEKGIISSTFGEHEHPVLKGIKTQNNGINIVTNGGSGVRAVFNGTVSGIMSIPNLNEVVIIRHGEYLTVYSNLETVNVKKGDKVKTKQNIGKVYTDPEESKTELHFEIWEGKRLLDPQQWLAR